MLRQVFRQTEQREHRIDGRRPYGANIATATKQRPRKTEKRDRIERARKQAEAWKEAWMYRWETGCLLLPVSGSVKASSREPPVPVDKEPSKLAFLICMQSYSLKHRFMIPSFSLSLQCFLPFSASLYLSFFLFMFKLIQGSFKFR